ncbi:MmgE/PrpD family protein [Deltaproteobacteria bacterium OttesenSCG-928-M10]|nr:MmgE/PrpD family protein [Deltaproteobacteria bacterium OttesenSCG-928-M10]
MTLTERLAEYTLSFNATSVRSEVKELAKPFFIDCLGCIIAGGQGAPSLIARQYCAENFGPKPTATVLASGGLKMDAEGAAMINGISSHFHDFDDVMPTMNGHPSAAVLPAVLAAAEECGASGEEALIAYIAGVEVCDIMSRGLNQEDHKHYQRGWHTTSTLGIFGATAAVALLRRLTQEQLVMAFSMAASEASGLKGNFGTMTKAFHAGRAAAKGIMAAKLGQLGYGANPNIIEMVEGFAYATTNGELGAEAMTARMDSGESVFISPGLTMKPYPCCKCNHNGIDAVYILKEKYNFKPEEVKSVVCGVQPFTMVNLKYPEAKTYLEGKFSMSYNVALSMLRDKRPGIRDFEGDTPYITDQAVLDFMKKVEMVVDHSIAGGAYANGGWEANVTVELNDGRSFKESVPYSRGESANPLTTDEVLEKFSDCMAVTLDPAKTGPVIDLLKDLETMPLISDLTAAIEKAVR